MFKLLKIHYQHWLSKIHYLASRLFDVPTEGYLGSRIDTDYNPAKIQEQREALIEVRWHVS